MAQVVLGLGGWLVRGMLEQMGTVAELAAAADLVVCPPGAGVPAELLPRCTVLIEEAGGTRLEAALLPAGCARILVPPCRLAILWPLLVQDDRILPGGGRIPLALGDRLALGLAHGEPDPVRRRQLYAEYREADLPAILGLDARHAAESLDMLAQEAGCDIRLAAYVLANMAELRLFQAHDRPTARLVHFALAQLYALAPVRALCGLGYPALLARARDWAERTAFAPGEQAPVHPQVARHFGLRWCPPDLRYACLGGWHSFDGWMDWYLSDLAVPPAGPDAAPPAELRPAVPPPSWPETLPAGEFALGLAARLPDRVMEVLGPAVRITRTQPFLALDPQPGAAPHGHFFTGPDGAGYAAGPDVVVELHQGVVLGVQGLVLHRPDGALQILGDSFRNLHAGAQATPLAALAADHVVLHPGQPARITRLDAPGFAGFGPDCGDLAQWLLTTLPRLVAFARLRRRFPELRLVLPPLPAASVQSDTLALLGIRPDDVATVQSDEALCCDRLLATSAFDLWSMSPQVCAAAAFLTRDLPPPRDGASSFTRIFLRPRAAAPRLQDFDSLAPVLESRGFASVFIEDLSLRQRVAIMRQARVVVAEHGPCLVHALFARPGAQVLELFAPAMLQPVFWSLCSVAGLGYGYAVGEGVPQGPFALRPDAFAAMLDAAIAGQSPA